jgi:enoyl-[acyl-carrier-protein] reductase (NADH)
VCVVTGANTGIGKETARGLARRGATVVLACRDVTKGEAARADVEASLAAGHAPVRVMALDLADRASIEAFAGRIKAEHGRLDVLVNNAGLSPRKRNVTKDGFESTFGREPPRDVSAHARAHAHAGAGRALLARRGDLAGAGGDDGRILREVAARDEAAQERLWQISEQLLAR